MGCLSFNGNKIITTGGGGIILTNDKKLGKDPINFLKPNYAAPPLLNELIERNEIDAVLNYWHYNARLKSKGYRELLSIENILKDLGIKTKIPAYGWVFSEDFGMYTYHKIYHY